MKLPEPGVILSPPPAAAAPHTVVVLGPPGSGAGMVAGLLRLMGVDMGEEIDEASGADTAFTAVSEQIEGSAPSAEFTLSGPIARLRRLIAERNAAAEGWGWRDPRAQDYVARVADLLRQPRYVEVYRDPLAMALREREGEAAAGATAAIVASYKRLRAARAHAPGPTLLVSYEKSLILPDALVASLAEFIGAAPDEAEREALASFVRPGRGHAGLDPESREADRAVRAERHRAYAEAMGEGP